MRIQFYSLGASLHRSAEEITKILSLKRYKKNTKKGFVIDSSDTICVRGRFIRRVERERTIVDPIGGAASFVEISFENTRFHFYPSRSVMCVLDPPRATRFLFASLEEAFGSGFELLELVWDPIKTKDILSEWFDTQIKEIECKNFTLGHNLDATLRVRGDKDAIQEIERIHENAIKKTSRIVLKVTNSKHEKFILEVRKDVVLVTSEEFFKSYEKKLLALIHSE